MCQQLRCAGSGQLGKCLKWTHCALPTIREPSPNIPSCTWIVMETPMQCQQHCQQLPCRWTPKRPWIVTPDLCQWITPPEAPVPPSQLARHIEALPAWERDLLQQLILEVSQQESFHIWSTGTIAAPSDESVKGLELLWMENEHAGGHETSFL